MPSFALTGRVALITGGSRGIGKAIALAYSKAGASVAVVGRDTNALDQSLKELQAEGGQAMSIAADVSRLDDIDSMIKETNESLGPIDILVNAAGIAIMEPADSVLEDSWTRLMDTNLKGQFFCASRVGRHMIRRGHGAIINISSEEGIAGVAGHAVYCISKAGIIHMTKTLAVEWGRYGVRVNCIAPAAVRTQINDRYWLTDQRAFDWVVSRIPLGRVSEPHEVAGAAVYLASEASAFVTGAVLTVDGGISAGMPREPQVTFD